MAIRNQIYIGSKSDPDYYFDNEGIDSASVVQNVALVGQELSVDSFTALVRDDESRLRDIAHFRSSDGQEIVLGDSSVYAVDVGDELQVSGLIRLESGTPVLFYQDSVLIGRFYVRSVVRKGKNLYQLDAVSAIGMLDEMDHGGGLFLSTTFGTVLQHILAAGLHGSGDPVIDYMIDDDVRDLPVSGWLPHDTKRNNLYRIVFANGVNIVKNVDSREDYNGIPRFTFLYTAPDAAEPIGEEPVYNQGDVRYSKPYTRVVVHEHTYSDQQSEEPAVLFDNSEGEGVNLAEVWFENAPVVVSSIVASAGLTIVSMTENSAILTGNGKLTGRPYQHSTRECSQGDPTAPDEKTIQVKNETFVNMINSANLINRLFAFYCQEDFIQEISNGIVYDGQRCGKVYSFKDPFGSQATAFLASMEITASAINKADCKFYANYVPAGQRGLYQHVDIIEPEVDPETGEPVTEGDWEVPDGVTEFKVVMIGGGTGGGSGWPGENGQDASCYTEIEQTADLSAIWYGAEGGEGGSGGTGGAPGRVKAVVVENAVPGTVYHWSLGEGGEGGAATGFIPDTVAQLRAALENENPGTTYTDAQIEEMIAQEDTDWDGSPNAGSDGTATTFGIEGGTVWSSADPDGYVPAGGVYEPITDRYFAQTGFDGIRGGKGGARKIQSGSTFNWVSDGEDVSDENGMVYRGGATGEALRVVQGLPEGKILAYGGNGAGAAVGIDRSTHEHINGGSDQETDWYIAEDD